MLNSRGHNFYVNVIVQEALFIGIELCYVKWIYELLVSSGLI